MRYLLYIVIPILFATSCSRYTLSIPAGDKSVLQQEEYDYSNTVIRNKSTKSLDISVEEKETGDKIRGFGLGPLAKATVMVERSNQLTIINDNDTKAKVQIEWKEGKAPQANKSDYISFTLANNTAKSIPLMIPTVMNPNLSPFSKSGVNLRIGQEILFKYKGKRRVLLTVSDSISNGDTLNVSRIIKERKLEIDNE